MPFPGVQPHPQTINTRHKGCFEGLFLLRKRGLWPHHPLEAGPQLPLARLSVAIRALSWAPGPEILGRRLSQEGNEASLFWGSRKRRWESRGKDLILRPVGLLSKNMTGSPKPWGVWRVFLGSLEGPQDWDGIQRIVNG